MSAACASDIPRARGDRKGTPGESTPQVPGKTPEQHRFLANAVTMATGWLQSGSLQLYRSNTLNYVSPNSPTHRLSHCGRRYYRRQAEELVDVSEKHK